jgi:hypothetical protein
MLRLVRLVLSFFSPSSANTDVGGHWDPWGGTSAAGDGTDVAGTWDPLG